MEFNSMDLNGGAAGIEQQDAGNILDRSVCLSLTLSKPGLRRKVKAGAIGEEGATVQTDADLKMVHVSKSIIDSPEFRDISKLDNEIRKYVASRCLPSGLRAGLLMLPNVSVKDVYAELDQKADERKALIRKFINRYPDLIEEARTRLGDLFEPKDYITAGALEQAFDMRVDCLAFSTPGKLRAIDPEIFERETAKFQANIAIATEEATLLMRSTAKDLVEHLLERLTPKPDGSAKVFHSTLISNVTEFAAGFPALNIANDAQLAGLVDKMGKLLAGVNPESLRTLDHVRDHIAAKMGEIKAGLDSLLIDRPKRVVDFEND